MRLELAVPQMFTSTGCWVQTLDSGTSVDARIAETLIENNIFVQPGQLVVVDMEPDPPQIVYRWTDITAAQVGGVYRVSQGGAPVNLQRLRAQTFEVLTGGDFAVDYAGSIDESEDEEGAGKERHLVPLPESMVDALRVKLNVWSQ